MTIKNNLFSWKKFQENISITTSMLIRVSFFFYCILFFSCANKEDFLLRPVRINDGWGYIISNNNKIVIKQSVIPVIAENKSFKSKDDALKVGNLVLQKIRSNLSPTVTKKDLILLEISLK